MKRLFLVALLSLCSLHGSWASSKADIKVLIDGSPVQFNPQTGFPYINEDNRVMVPIRTCLESIDCTVDWNQSTQTAQTYKGSTRVDIPIGAPQLIRNKTIYHNDTSAVVVEGRTYLPLRSVFEAYGYKVDWNSTDQSILISDSQTASIHLPFDDVNPSNVNGGSTGIFLRKQLEFQNFNAIQADITLPRVEALEEGQCPYLYFGFDGSGDVGNAEAGFQYIFDPSNPHYTQWVVYLRQGSQWSWGQNSYVDSSSTHHLQFQQEVLPSGETQLVVTLDGTEVVRQNSVSIPSPSVKQVIGIGMNNGFDGISCKAKLYNAKFSNVTVKLLENNDFLSFESYPYYHKILNTIHYGSTECIPKYLHYLPDGSISIYE